MIKTLRRAQAAPPAAGSSARPAERHPSGPPPRTTTAQGPSRRRGPRAPASLSRVGVNLILLVVVCYTVLPPLWLLMASTKNLTDLFGTNGFAPGRHFNLPNNLHHLFAADGGIYLRWLWNTLLYAGGGAVLAAFICAMAGYAFDKFAFRGKEALYGLVLVGVMIPSAALVLPTYLLASNVGLVNGFWGVFVPGLVFPFGVYLARIFSASYVPDEVVEATRVDGAGELRSFWSVALPMMRPGVVTIGLFQFTAIWNNFFLPMVMLSDDRLYPVNLGLYTWNSNALSQGNPDDYLLAITGSLVAIVPLIVLFLAVQRFWRSGMTAGAVK
ncbi:carbohydrate ABC transporter membrane protein 2 (CUT1 family) [Actinocorallia herbida]|uniref:Carbohydrate ABC transporter membrane protein 2 (CUT1 family) n=1 Tax=Actinocorallia herbida TaxID=58109 RepID=A0A3N1CUY5_9ACTN|nr:carbohydrate ABC transporter permease [Actinocorallia herbida]ROO85087.1 carbohydrate ABC transporter membrane protein 2 (CUT1 family) [Actinocorallia herbida]